MGEKKWVKPKDLNCKNMGHSTDAECYKDGLLTFIFLIVVVRQSSLFLSLNSELQGSDYINSEGTAPL